MRKAVKQALRVYRQHCKTLYKAQAIYYYELPLCLGVMYSIREGTVHDLLLVPHNEKPLGETMRPELRIGDLVRFRKCDSHDTDVLYRVVNYRLPDNRMFRRRIRTNSTSDGFMEIVIQPVGSKNRWDQISVQRKRLWKIPAAHQPRMKRKNAAVRRAANRW
jgi:hypothetical protein